MAAPLIRPNTCSTCSFRFTDGQQMFCRRRPPTASIVIMPKPSGPPAMGWQSAFPPVQPDWWCGDFSALTVLNNANDPAPVAS